MSDKGRGSLDFNLFRVAKRQQVQIGHAPRGRLDVFQLDQHLVVPQNLHGVHVPVQAEQVEHAVAVDRHAVQPVDQHNSVGPHPATRQPGRIARRRRRGRA